MGWTQGEGVSGVKLAPVVLGYMKNGAPIWSVAGGAEDDGGADFDTAVDGDGDAKSGESDDDADELEDLSREELYARLKDANKTAKTYRLRLKRARQAGAGRRDRGDEPNDRDDDRTDRRRDQRDGRRRDDDERDDRRRRESSRDVERAEERAIRAEAKSALAAAGIPADRLARAVRLIDLRGLELDDDDDELIGIDDEIDALKAEWPELFERRRSSRNDDDRDERDSRRPARRIPRADTRGAGRTGRESRRMQKTATEIQAEMLSRYAGN